MRYFQWAGKILTTVSVTVSEMLFANGDFRVQFFDLPSLRPLMHKRPIVLIVDAAPNDRARYRQELTDEYEVLDAENGTGALALCEHTRPDCVLLDYQLPDIDGLALLAKLLNDNGAGAIAVVVATNLDHTPTAVQMLKSGAYDYLLKKDLSTAKLKHALRNALNGVALKAQLQEHRAALAARNRELERQLALANAHPPTRNVRPSPRRILVVDSNRDNADSLSMMLGAMGHDVHIAYDETGALETAAKTHPEIVMLDLGMAHVGSQTWGGKIIVIELDEGEDRPNRPGVATPCRYRLTKPVQPDTLTKILSDLTS
jgi:CheY-like chemotaxis protein